MLLTMAYEDRIALPHTNLTVGRIGLGSSFGVPAEGLELAFDHGINWFYWGSVRRAGFGEGIRRLAARSRDDIVVVLQSYARWPAAWVRQSVESGLRRLSLDRADVLVLGWYNARPSQAVLDTAFALREEGKIGHLMMSGHNRPFFSEMAQENVFDAFMVRYNARSRGAERDVFPRLAADPARPAICAYTATSRGTLLDRGKVPAGEPVPTAGDCYRFCLSHPAVDLVLCGPANLGQVEVACRALAAGPLDPEQLAWMQRVGDSLAGRTPKSPPGD
ncbi:MAG: aldo/keto reductase [Myxococcales bacterium]|nr:aldo/keto reductase [Myxococcales bacterium]